MKMCTHTLGRGVVAVSAALALGLAACGDGGDETATPTETDTTTTEATAPTTGEGMTTGTPGGTETGQAAQPTGAVITSDQEGDGSTVTVDSATLEGIEQGWVVMHASEDGAPGAVQGFAAISQGDNADIEVSSEPALTESQQLFAMLHADDGEVDTYEFGQVEGVDLPVTTDGAPVVAPFQFTVTG